MHSDGLGTHWDLARYPGLCAGIRHWLPLFFTVIFADVTMT